MSAATLCAWALVGLVAGWLLPPPRSTETTRPAPLVSWAQPLALFLVAAILGGTAWSTRRTRAARTRPALARTRP